MKKLAIIAGVFVMLLVLIAYPAAAGETTFILVYDFLGQSGYGESGVTIAGESLYDLGKVITLGYGVEIPLHTLKSPQLFGFVPVFGVVKVSPFPASFPLDFSFRGGYSYLVGDSRYTENATLYSGSYFGYGLGYYFERDAEEGTYTKVELLYSECKGIYETGGVSTPLKYARYSILFSFGYDSL